MERVVHIAAGFADAARHDIRQQVRMTPQERILAARELQRRVYGANPIDIRAWHRPK
jgi:hypothetical protein